MAERRMFAKTIIDSDAFLDMPLSSQALYFHLNMRADDDGFINNPKRIMRLIGCSDDDLKILIMKSFVINFETGVIVIKHWKINNYLRSDRHKPTLYQDEKSMLVEKENKAYSLGNNDLVYQWYTSGIPSIGKNSIDKISIEEDSIEEDASPISQSTPSLFEKFEAEFARPVSPLETQMLIEWQKEHDDDVITLALAESVKNNARSMRYIEVILASWKQSGVRSVEEAKQQIEAKKKTRSYSNQSSNNNVKGINRWYEDQDKIQRDEDIHVDDEELQRLMNSLGGDTSEL